MKKKIFFEFFSEINLFLEKILVFEKKKFLPLVPESPWALTSAHKSTRPKQNASGKTSKQALLAKANGKKTVGQSRTTADESILY